jgi:serine protease inhibitor
MEHSKIHQLFSLRVNEVAFKVEGKEYTIKPLVNPSYYLGRNYENVLLFWRHLETLNHNQWETIKSGYDSLNKSVKFSAEVSASNAAISAGYEYVTNVELKKALGMGGIEAGVSALKITNSFAAYSATQELMGMHLLLDSAKKLTFLPLFDGFNVRTTE